MAVTVKIADKAKQRPAGAEPIPDLADYGSQRARAEGTKVLLIWMALMLVACAILSSLEFTRGFGIGIFVWWLASVFVYFVLAPRFLLRRLRLHGAQYEINAKTHPRLQTLISKGSALIDIPQPDGFLVDEGISQIRITGRRHPFFMIVTKAATESLQPTELDCLLLRALVHARLGHVPRLMLLQFIADTPAPARALVWPVVLYGTLLRLMWLEYAEQSADRVTLLLVKNVKVLTSAVLKQHVITDPFMQEENVTTQDVDNFIKQGKTIGTQGMEISIQYKLGQAIHENPYLEERVDALSAWASSTDFAAAVEKLAAARTTK